MRFVVRWSVVIAAVLLLACSVSLVACGSSGDPYTGTWVGQGQEWVIKPAKDGWWSLSEGGSHPLYAAEMHSQLETGNAGLVFKRSGDKLTLTMLDVPIELTKQ